MKAFALALVAGAASALESWGQDPYALPKQDWISSVSQPKYHPRSSRAQQAKGWNKQITDPWAKSSNNPWNSKKAAPAQSYGGYNLGYPELSKPKTYEPKPWEPKKHKHWDVQS